jgi:hypothetical protein
MKYKAEVQVAGENGWHGNALTFDTRQKAEDYAKDLHSRWLATTGWRVVEITKQKGEV